MPNIKLQSLNGDIFDTDVQVAKCSGLIKTMLEDLGIENNEDDTVVPLPNVSSDILTKVLQWITYHKDDPEPMKDDEDKEIVNFSEWDTEFLNTLDMEVLFELIKAANYLDIKGLLNMTCQNVANMMKGKSAEEIRQIFNIKNDFTPEEEEQIRKENEWCEEK